MWRGYCRRLRLVVIEGEDSLSEKTTECSDEEEELSDCSKPAVGGTINQVVCHANTEMYVGLNLSTSDTKS